MPENGRFLDEAQRAAALHALFPHVHLRPLYNDGPADDPGRSA